MGGGGSFLLSEVRRESGGEIRPEAGCEGAVRSQLPLEYGGGGPLLYIEAGLTIALPAIVEEGP
jgi:hypothetical protein